MQDSNPRNLIWQFSPLVWPIFFLTFTLYLFQGVPLHWTWDTFSYMDAALSGRSYVKLGDGRIGYSIFGNLLQWFSTAPSDEFLFSLFRRWILVTLVLEAAMIGGVALFIVRMIGVLPAHLFAAVVCTDAQFIRYSLHLYPENMCLVILGLICLVLGLWKSPWAVCVAIVLSSLLVVMKEVSLMYIPFVAVWIGARMGRTFVLRAAWVVGIGFSILLAYLVFNKLTGQMIEGLAGTREELVAGHFSMTDTGPAYALQNAKAVAVLLTHTPGVLAALIVSIFFLAVRLQVNTVNYQDALRFPIAACLLFTGPLVLVSLLAKTDIVPRYWVAMLPGAAALAAMGFEGIDLKLTSDRVRAGLGVALIVLIVLTSDRALLAHDVHTSRRDLIRYDGMVALKQEPMVLLAGADSWPALYISTHGSTKADWQIMWPAWDWTVATNLPLAQLHEEVAKGKLLAFSQKDLAHWSVTEEFLLAEFPQLEFAPHYSGWLVGRPR